MRILADENFPAGAVLALRQRGHDVLYTRTEFAGAPDRLILERAQQDGRLVVTFDKGFGELAFHAELPATCGVVLLRISLPSPAEVTRKIVALLESRDDWAGNFATVTDDRIRLRPLPSMPNGPR